MEKLQRNWYALIVPAAIITALLASLGLPTLFPALASTRFRLGLLLAVVAVFGAAAAWRWWRMRRGAAALGDALVAPDTAATEAAAVSTRLRDALAELRRAGGTRRGYLYAKPWYVIIGPPGAGKTTAFTHSGLRFPHEQALRGDGGTRHLDFWFADDAVLVDTAGRYTTQDSDPHADSRGWTRLLTLLRRTRPREPINGVIVALGVDALSGDDRAALDAHAAAVRRRLHELHRELRVAVPVYLLFTKTDLLAGFTEFFADLTAEGRRAVLGATLAPGASVSAEAVTSAFDRMTDAVAARSAKRLHDELDLQRRSRILGFPAQLVALRARLARFVGGILPADGDEDGHALRGVYFTSGTQAGAPLDHLLAQLATVYEEELPAPALMRGRAFFLHRLFTEIIFPEAGMVRAEATTRRRRQLAHAGGLGVIGIATFALLLLWAGSFGRNQELQAAGLAGARGAAAEIAASGADLAEVRDGDADLAQLLPVLDRLRALPGGYADQAAGTPPWRTRLGLYQWGHARAAREAYTEALQRIMLPRLMLELEQALHADRGSPIRLYAPLKAYLILGGYGAMDARAVRSWVISDWRERAIPGADRAETRRRLAVHLEALLGEEDLGRVWMGGRAPLDGALLADTRAAVIALPLADRAYAMIRQRAASAGGTDWHAAAVLAESDSRAFGNGAAVLGLTVPWFLTRDGYARAFRPAVAAIGAELDRELWVLGPDARKDTLRGQLAALGEAVARDYARDYVAAWDAVLATPRAADYLTDRDALGSFTRSPAPLRVLAEQAVAQTRLAHADAPPDARFDAGAAITAHFAPVAAFVRGGAGVPAPVDALVQSVRQAASASSASTAAGATLGGDAARGAFAAALGDLATAGAGAPPQLDHFIDDIARTGRGAAVRSVDAALNGEYADTILRACRVASARRYPFDPGAAVDATPADLQRVFGINGVLDGFVRTRLQPLLDTTPPRWRWVLDDPAASHFSPGSAEAFGKAAAVRDLVVGGIPLQVSVATLGAGVSAVELVVGDTRHRIEAGDAAERLVMWNPAALPQARLALIAGERTLYSVERGGSFALFRLVAAGQAQNAGERAILVWFGSGAQRTALRVTYSTASNPFSRNGPFSFRCPEHL